YPLTDVSLARTNERHLLATYCRRAALSETGDILVARSRDGGRTWAQQTQPLFSGDHQLASIACLSDGVLIAAATSFEFLFENSIRWRIGAVTGGVYLRASQDGGYSWNDARAIDTAPFPVAFTRGAVVEMDDGTLLLPLAGRRGSPFQVL